MDAIQRRRLALDAERLVCNVGTFLLAASTASDPRCHSRSAFREEPKLHNTLRAPLKLVGDGFSPILAKELTGTLCHWQQADHTLLRLENSTFPVGQPDAERLCETTNDVEDQAITPLVHL